MSDKQSTGVADFVQYGEERAPDRRANCTATPQTRHLRRFIAIGIGLCAAVSAQKE